MHNDASQPSEHSKTVFYRCLCGAEAGVDPTTGGICGACQRVISPKFLQHGLSLTTTIRGKPDHVVQEQGEPSDFNAIDLIGRTFGHFEILRPLGRGGMGQVYQALDTSLQRYVAVKVLQQSSGGSTSTASDARHVDLLLQEAVAQARVEHPNIVTIYFVGKQDDEPFFAMELVNGVSVSQRIADSDLSFGEIATIAIQITRALQFSYGLDVIHGDLKPSNILLQPNGNAKLSDFGMARRASDNSKDAFGGTPNYLAPELLGEGNHSIQSDMYALGVTLYEMTFGQLPVQLTGSNLTGWRSCHATAVVKFPHPWPEHLPDQWGKTLKKMLAKDPVERYASYEELADDLRLTEPRNNVISGAMPRLIAALLDVTMVVLLMMPFQFLLGSPSFHSFFDLHPLVTFVVQALNFLPILFYTAIVFFWRQSVGRLLMHLRVINRYGVAAASRLMALRSIPRMILPWTLALLSFLTHTNADWLQGISAVFSVTTVVFFTLDTAFLVFNKQRRSIHDLLFDTKVVLDAE